VVQPFDGRVLSDAALSRAAGGPELDSSGGESLGSFGQSRSSSRPEPHSGPVEHEQLATQAFNPMPGLRTGVIELAATVTASGERKGENDNDEHHRDKHHRGHQHCGHTLDGTPADRDLGGHRLLHTVVVIVCPTTADRPACRDHDGAGGGCGRYASASRPCWRRRQARRPARPQAGVPGQIIMILAGSALCGIAQSMAQLIVSSSCRNRWVSALRRAVVMESSAGPLRIPSFPNT